MTATRKLAALMVLIAFGAVPVAATNYEFTGNTSNVWGIAGNWTPAGGPPGSSDHAWIPTGKVCTVSTAMQAAKTIDVDGTLGIEGQIFKLGENTGSSFTTSTVDGTLYLKKVSDTVGAIKIHDTVTINGSGTITGKKDDGYEGRIRRFDWEEDSRLYLGAGMTITGSIQVWITLFLTGHAQNPAQIVVDDADDVFEMGKSFMDPYWEPVVLQGQGTVSISAGQMKLLNIQFPCTACGYGPRWTLSGGELAIPQITASSLNMGSNHFTMSGGVFDIDRNTTQHGDFTFTGGQIEVAQNKSVQFEWYDAN